MDVRFSGAAAALRHHAPAVIETWLVGYQRSPLRMPSGVDVRQLGGPAAGIVDALALGLGEPGCAPGAASLREAEKRVAFAGGSLGMAGASTFDVIAFVIALRDALVGHGADAVEKAALARLFDWLGAVALEGYSTSRADAMRLRHRDALERGTPVVMVTRELPAAFLVGDPDRSVLDVAFGRLLLSIVRVDARAAIVDGSGLVSPVDAPVLEALGVFAAHRKLAAVTTLLTGLPSDAEEAWKAVFPPGARVVAVERFDDAVSRAQTVPRRG
jgi:hypothetical protein